VAEPQVPEVRTPAAPKQHEKYPWPEHPTQIGNCYHSQFQIPLLFYVLVILAWITKQADLIFVVMAWIFVIARLAHAYIHTTSNHVPTRFWVFAVGMLVLLLMWIIFAVRILIL